MLVNISIAGFMLVVTTAIHAVAMMLALQAFKREEACATGPLTRISRVSGIVLLMFLAAFLEVLVWAFTYLSLGAIQGIEKAIYFSMVTYTTLGYGEIVFDEQWRLLASFEAANGILLFGWSTAVILAAVQRIYFGEIIKFPHSTESDQTKKENSNGPGPP